MNILRRLLYSRLRSPGFTLFEILLYTAFIGIIMTGAILLAFSALTMRSTLRASTILEGNVRFALGRIHTLMENASAISSPATSTAGEILTLTMAAPELNPTIINVSDGTLFLSQGTGAAASLISNEVIIRRVTFARVSSTTPAIRFVLTAGLRNAAISLPSITVTTTESIRR